MQRNMAATKSGNVESSFRILLPVPPRLLCLFSLDLVFDFPLGKALSHALFLLPPVASFFVVLADAQRFAQTLAFLHLRLGQVVHLVRLQPLRVGTEVFAVLPLLCKLPAQGLALVVDVVLVDAGGC